jgi:hypothetical protein
VPAVRGQLLPPPGGVALVKLREGGWDAGEDGGGGEVGVVKEHRCPAQPNLRLGWELGSRGAQPAGGRIELHALAEERVV